MVGNAAGLIVIVVAFLLIRGLTKPPDSGRLLAEARSLLADGSKTSDLGKLGTALAKVDSVLKKGANSEAETLKQSIERKQGDIKDASDLVAKADSAYLKDNFEKAKEYATMARGKDPNNAQANGILDAIAKKIHWTPPAPIPPPPIPPYDRALAAYDRGSREEAKGIVDSILKTSPDDLKAKELQGRIEKWELGLYLIGRGEIEEAVKTFNDLLATSPGNPAFNEIINRYKYDSDKARKLFEDAKPHWTAWVDYGAKEEFEQAKALYKQIVDMHAPPATAAQEDKDNYNTAKERAESK